MVWSRILGVSISILLAVTANGQNRYMVFFKDKTGTPYTLDQPGQFLTAKALARRTHQNISVTAQDLPVNPDYIAAVKSAGAEVFFPTRWLNGVLIQCEESLLPTLNGIPSVDHIEFVAPEAKLAPSNRKRGAGRSTTGRTAQVTDDQLKMLGVDQMHTDGYKGEDRVIAIFDSGFEGVNTAAPFQHLFANNQIDLAVSQDFVYNHDHVFQYDSHGTYVFSTISAYSEGVFTGGAYKAKFQLYVTEEVPTEYRVEEYNWLFAAERADSAGADIIQSSLGYNDFDGTTMDYPKSALNGSTTVVSKAAQWAADRGMLVICSAGNEGNTAWQTITAPADAVDVLSVANVNRDGERSGSSSTGPSADQRIKPDVAALGSSTSVIVPEGSTGNVSGTSLAAPLITGLAAGVWQRFPHLTNKQIIEAIRLSASQGSSPDNLIGYGIPNYRSIVNYLSEKEQKRWFDVFPNPLKSSDTLVIRPKNPTEVAQCRIELVSIEGKAIQSRSIQFSWNAYQYEASLQELAPGTYFLKIFWEGKTFIHKIVRQ